MNEITKLGLAWASGGVLGAAFFGGLWYTVRQGISAEQPALWFAGSLLSRSGILVLGFYFFSGRQWQQLVLGLFGFFTAHVIATSLARWSKQSQVNLAREANNAP